MRRSEVVLSCKFGRGKIESGTVGDSDLKRVTSREVLVKEGAKDIGTPKDFTREEREDHRGEDERENQAGRRNLLVFLGLRTT